MRKALTVSVLVGAFFLLWVNFAQAGEDRGPDRDAQVCTAASESVNVAQCAHVGVEVGELGVGDVVDDLTDTVTDTDLVGDLL